VIFPITPPDLLSGVTSLFQSHPLDKGRLEQNQQLFQQALQGDKAALASLLLRSGYSTDGRGDGGPGYGYLPTKTTRDDAWNKYRQVIGQVGAPGGAPVSSGVQLASAPGLLDKLLDVLGLGPTRQAQLAQTAGAAAGGQVADSIRFAVLVVAGIVVLLVVLRALRR
jgi:hypothetical protein